MVGRQHPGPHLDPGLAASGRRRVAVKRIVLVAKDGPRPPVPPWVTGCGRPRRRYAQGGPWRRGCPETAGGRRNSLLFCVTATHSPLSGDDSIAIGIIRLTAL